MSELVTSSNHERSASQLGGSMKMITYFPALLALVSMTLFGLICGFFYAYSVDVMRGLDRISPDQAITAMQAINEAVRNPVFFVTFFLTPVVALVSAAVLFKTGMKASALYLSAAAVLYLLGAFLPTVAINVPMNEALATVAVQAGNSDLMTIWQDYSARWTFWNTARTVVSTASLFLSGMALLAAR